MHASANESCTAQIHGKRNNVDIAFFGEMRIDGQWLDLQNANCSRIGCLSVCLHGCMCQSMCVVRVHTIGLSRLKLVLGSKSEELLIAFFFTLVCVLYGAVAIFFVERAFCEPEVLVPVCTNLLWTTELVTMHCVTNRKKLCFIIVCNTTVTLFAHTGLDDLHCMEYRPGQPVSVVCCRVVVVFNHRVWEWVRRPRPTIVGGQNDRCTRGCAGCPHSKFFFFYLFLLFCFDCFTWMAAFDLESQIGFHKRVLEYGSLAGYQQQH